MSIFRRDPESPREALRATSPAPARRPRSGLEPQVATAVTVIASGTHIVGEVSGTAGLRIEGRLEGTARIDGEVVVAAGGESRAEIHARQVRIAGKARGGMRGEEVVELTATGSLEGDISAPRVVIAEGAFFKGQVRMDSGG